MNVLCLGARVIGASLAGDIVQAFLGARFSGEPRHQRRLDKILDIERRFNGR
jgi:ribose 5-phosphate isomerase B